jgi:hypothetical protein
LLVGAGTTPAPTLSPLPSKPHIEALTYALDGNLLPEARREDDSRLRPDC